MIDQDEALEGFDPSPQGKVDAYEAGRLREWLRLREREKRTRGKVRCSTCAHQPERSWLPCEQVDHPVSGAGHWRRCDHWRPAQDTTDAASPAKQEPKPTATIIPFPVKNKRSPTGPGPGAA